MGVTPSNTRAQHRKSFPEAGPRNRETAWPGEPKETVFGPALGWSSVSNVASRTKKKAGFAAEGFNLHLAVAKPGLSTEKASQKPGRETGKQHGLASPRRPFLDLRWGGLQCQTSRPEPIKKEGFAAEGFNLHLAVASVSNVASRTKKKAGLAAEGFNLHLAVAKPGLSTEKASQKPGRETGKQHGLASPRRPFLDLRWGGLQCQTLRPEPKKKRVLQLRASICTSQWQNQDSAPKKLPRSRAAKQGNSMAWRAQGDRFWTCVGVVFSVKRRVQNL